MIRHHEIAEHEEQFDLKLRGHQFSISYDILVCSITTKSTMPLKLLHSRGKITDAFTVDNNGTKPTMSSPTVVRNTTRTVDWYYGLT